ncbi:MAG: DUF5131 family protein [Isosphaeraceae bacterium]
MDRPHLEPRPGLHAHQPRMPYYAEQFAERFRGVAGHPYEQGFDLRLVPEKLAEPLLWRRPSMVFVNSMVTCSTSTCPTTIVAVAEVMVRALLAHVPGSSPKRSERLRDLLRTTLKFAADTPHIWWGVSVENRRHGLPRVEHLRGARPA